MIPARELLREPGTRNAAALPDGSVKYFEGTLFVMHLGFCDVDVDWVERVMVRSGLVSGHDKSLN